MIALVRLVHRREMNRPPNRYEWVSNRLGVQSRRTNKLENGLCELASSAPTVIPSTLEMRASIGEGGELPTGSGRKTTSSTQQRRCIHFVGVPRPTATEKRHGVLLLLGLLEAHGNNPKGFRLPKATAAKMMGVTRRTVQRWAKELHPLGLIDDAPDGIKIGANYAAWCKYESAKAKANGAHWQRDALPSRILHANAKAQHQATPCVLVAAAGIWQEADDAREFVRGSRERSETAATSRRTVTAAIKLLVAHKAITLRAITRTIKKRLCRLLKVEAEKMAKVCSLAVGFVRLAAWEQHAKHGAGGATGGNHGGATGEHHPHLSFGERSSSLRTKREENRILKNEEMIAQPRERQTLGQLASKIQQEQGALAGKNQQAKHKAMVRVEVHALAADEQKLAGLLMHPNQGQSVTKLLLLAGVYESGMTGKRRAKLNRKRDQLAQSLVAVHKNQAATFIWRILSRTCKTERVRNIGAFLAVSSERSLQIQRPTAKPAGFAPQPSQAMLEAVNGKLADYRFSWDHKAITKNNELVMQRNNITHEVIASYLNMPLEEFEVELIKRIKRTA